MTDTGSNSIESIVIKLNVLVIILHDLSMILYWENGNSFWIKIGTDYNFINPTSYSNKSKPKLLFSVLLMICG